MNASHDRRLARLKQAKLEQERRPAARVLYVWCNSPTETTNEAITRSFPDGLPTDARTVIKREGETWIEGLRLAGDFGDDDP